MKTEARTLLAEVGGRGREGGQSEGKAKMHTPMAASRGAAVRRQSDSASVPLWGDRERKREKYNLNECVSLKAYSKRT